MDYLIYLVPIIILIMYFTFSPLPQFASTGGGITILNGLIEKHGESIHAYRLGDNLFLGQADSVDNLTIIINKRFPHIEYIVLSESDSVRCLSNE